MRSNQSHALASGLPDTADEFKWESPFQAARYRITLREGVYFGLSGPFFESPAELRFLRGVGADAVGMSTVNEVLAARHGGMRVLGFSGITNVARLSEDEGEPPTHDEVMAAAPKLAPKLQAILLGVLERLAQ